MNKDEALRLALEALENSVDLVRENAYNAEQLYGNYPARQGKVRGLKVLADDHEKAITAVEAALKAKNEFAFWERRPDGKIGPTNSPQRTWVGLNETECGFLFKVGMTPFDYYQAIEAKLKEKNG